MADSLSRGESPIASHLLYTQPGILDDTLPEERMRGICAGFAWGDKASLIAFYTDLDWSRGMTLAKAHYGKCNKRMVLRRIQGWSGE